MFFVIYQMIHNDISHFILLKKNLPCYPNLIQYMFFTCIFRRNKERT
ncbi:hypothetical protein KM92DES2_10795 [uncultured Desulfovibrio sp.]|uniref:Uncharacterized protein n=1 Tax=uncultured Desulfovibrio sp. TaxID=167968 RepID=A0A212JAI6_9BACT|nr:hypothetical protein KM92DES2_10795 [uncultured Desulfovibrio sp.]